MVRINENYQKLQGSYLFSTIAKKVGAYTAQNPDKKIIRLGIGDVTRPLSSSNSSIGVKSKSAALMMDDLPPLNGAMIQLIKLNE